MADLLSAASLFFAAIGLLYSAWYDEIVKAINLKAPEHRDDRGPSIKLVRAAYRGRALPLALASMTLAGVLLPDLTRVISDSIEAVLRQGVNALRSYDAVKTLFCALSGAALGLAVHTARMALKTRRQLRKLEQ